RYVNVGRLGTAERRVVETETGRQYTHDIARLTIQTQRLPHCGAIRSHVRSPEVIADYNHLSAARPVLIGRKRPAQRCPHAQQGEKRRGYACRDDAHGFVRPSELKVEMVHESHVFEDVTAPANFHKLGNAGIVSIDSA